MKKLSIAIVAAGLLTLAACNKSPEAQAVENAGDNASATVDNAADMLEAAADNSSNAATEASLENAADNAHAAAGNISDAADAQADAVDANSK